MGRRVADLLGYHPPVAQHTTYVVVRGDSLGAIATRNGMSLDDLVAYNNNNGNPIPNPSAIRVGQQILLPNPDAVPEAPVTPTVELSRYPLPEEVAPTPVPEITPEVTPTPEVQTSPDAEKGGETPKPQAEGNIFQRFIAWLSRLFGGGN
jgi:LysM repeat protein